MYKTPCTEEEREFLVNNYLKLSDCELAEAMNRTKNAVKALRKRFKLIKPTVRFKNGTCYARKLDITNEDVIKIKNWLPCKTNKEIAEGIGISIHHFRKLQEELGIYRKGLTLKQVRQYQKTKYVATEEQVEQIRSLVDSHTDPQICRIMNVQSKWVKAIKDRFNIKREDISRHKHFTEREINYCLENCDKKAMRQIAEELGIAVLRVKAIARKHNIQFRHKGKLCRKNGEKFINSLHGKPEWFIKVNGKNVRYSKYLWEQKYGKIPEGYKLYCKDGNRMNLDLSNYELKSMVEQADLAQKLRDEESFKKISDGIKKARRKKSFYDIMESFNCKID